MAPGSDAPPTGGAPSIDKSPFEVDTKTLRPSRASTAVASARGEMHSSLPGRHPVERGGQPLHGGRGVCKGPRRCEQVVPLDAAISAHAGVPTVLKVSAKEAGAATDHVALVTQIRALATDHLAPRPVGRLKPATLAALDRLLRLILGL